MLAALTRFARCLKGRNGRGIAGPAAGPPPERRPRNAKRRRRLDATLPPELLTAMMLWLDAWDHGRCESVSVNWRSLVLASLVARATGGRTRPPRGEASAAQFLMFRERSRSHVPPCADATSLDVPFVVGTQRFLRGRHCFRVDVINPDDDGAGLILGVYDEFSRRCSFLSLGYFHADRDASIYSNNELSRSKTTPRWDEPTRVDRAIEFAHNGTVDVHIDLDAQTLEYAINGAPRVDGGRLPGENGSRALLPLLLTQNPEYGDVLSVSYDRDDAFPRPVPYSPAAFAPPSDS